LTRRAPLRRRTVRRSLNHHHSLTPVARRDDSRIHHR
jgi:hypothetical protein